MTDDVHKSDLPPPAATVGVIGWARHNLFATPFDSVLTLFAVYLIITFVFPALNWAIFDASWLGKDQSDCTGDGACWVFIISRINFFIYGFIDEKFYWRVNLVFIMLALLIIPQFFSAFPKKSWLGWFLVTVYPVISYILLVGGSFGLADIDTGKWGGLMLTLVISFVGIVAALPIGVLLALGRRSKMPVIRGICIGFIELWRGVPLISILFMASVMLPLFLPEGVDFNKLLRAMIGIVMFQSAYMAEVIRGGLQGIAKGQYEAAEALGLNYWKSMGLIILPQALKLVIPGIVNTFIALFKDTTLVLIIGLLDVLASVQAAIIDPAWKSVATEGYVFAAAVFWVFCFSMSRYSQALERKLRTGYKR
ncbi:MAG TPA: amino acid ABC transporter permease [Rhodospirillales bacterium]|nr:amino acid ABC transporter permease [Rhodospirillales bacterium]